MGKSKRVSKVVLVTGASTGIGRAMAEVFAKKGDTVYGGARKPKDLEELAGITGIEPIQLDVTHSEDVKQAVEIISGAGGGLDALVNNAGIALPGPLMEVPVEEIAKQFEVNAFGVHRLTRACFPLLMESKGRVVNMSSFGGTFVYPFFGAYSMTKFALEAYSDALRRELYPLGIEVVVVRPGRVNTSIWEKGDENLEKYQDTQFGVRIKRWANRTTKASNESDLTPQTIAKVVYEAIHARKSKISYEIFPSPMKYWFYRRLPTRWMDKLLNRV